MTYSKAQIEGILRERTFGYHRVDLPFGLHTEGKDRAGTRNLIFPESLAGKTVLDVGCAFGYFCFEAEALGAARVLGLELKKDRLEGAQLLKEIKGSKVEVRRQDVTRDPLGERFDYVLLLNVIHHLTDPLRLIRELATLTDECLVIEFPTLKDRRFREGAGVTLPPEELDQLPLIGVDEKPKRTFVYSPAAIERILTYHARLVDRVEIVPSPGSSRAIALCYK